MPPYPLPPPLPPPTSPPSTSLPASQILYRTVALNVLNGEDTEEVVEEVVPYRQYTVQEMDLLCTIHGLSIEATYGEMNMGVDLNHEEAYRMVMVIKKPAEGEAEGQGPR